MSLALTSEDFPLIRFSIEETERLVELSDSSACILKFVGSTVEYIQIKPLEYSKEAALAFHFDISVLNNGPKIVTGRPTQTYAVSLRLSGRKALSINPASSIDFESITTESNTQTSVDQLLKIGGTLSNRERWRRMRLPLRLFVWFAFFAPRRIIFRFAECAASRIPI
jgi:hypothetical protein